MAKISILGASGTIGKSTTLALARENIIDEIIMYSRPSSFRKLGGEARDMYESLAVENINIKLTPSKNIEDIAGSDVVIITAGIARSPGMSRLDLAVPNAKIVGSYARDVAKYAPDSIIIVVTNPVDVLTTVALKASKFDKHKVMGLGNHLDSLRFKASLTYHFDINGSEVHTRVIGEHGEHMVPLLSSTTIGGIPLSNFVNYTKFDLDEALYNVKYAGRNIIARKGATEYGPASAVASLVSTIINDGKQILTVSAYLDGEIEDIKGVSLGVPALLTREGIRSIIRIKMDDDELEQFMEAAEVVRESTEELKEEFWKYLENLENNDGTIW